MQTNFSLPPPLSPEEVETIVREAARVLEVIGVECTHERAREILLGATACRARGPRLHFDGDEILAHLDRRRAEGQRKPPPPTDFALADQWNCLNLCEPVTRVIRPATESDAIAMARLAEMLGKRDGPIPLAPAYVEPALQTLEAERVALLHTRHCGGWLTATDRAQIRFLADMNRAAGRRYRLGLEGMISPLRVSSEVLRVYFENCDDPALDLKPLTIIPMAGATAPLALPAALVQVVAEGIGWDFILRHVSEGRLSCVSLRLDPFDMRAGNIAIGTPEWCLLRQLIAAIHERVTGQPDRHGSFRSNARLPDFQAQVQRTASVLWQALAGLRRFGAVGQLCMDEVFSPVQAIYDREILRYVERLLGGLGGLWDPQQDAIEVIREGLEAGGFLEAATTVRHCRRASFVSPLFDARNLGSWRRGGGIEQEVIAWEEAKKLIAAHDFTLPDDRRREVERIYQKAVAAVRG